MGSNAAGVSASDGQQRKGEQAEGARGAASDARR